MLGKVPDVAARRPPPCPDTADVSLPVRITKPEVPLRSMLPRVAQSVGRLPSNDEANNSVADPSSVTVRLVAGVPRLPRAKIFRPVGIRRLPNCIGGSAALPVEATVHAARPALVTGVALARAVSQSGALAEGEGGTLLSEIARSTL
jgi:hypothetical protein